MALTEHPSQRELHLRKNTRGKHGGERALEALEQASDGDRRLISGLVRTDAELDEHEHAMAVSMGENAMLVTLERFLLDREARAGELLRREGKP